MKSLQTLVAGLLMLLSFGLLAPAAAQPAEHRIALVIGNGAYSTAPLQTPANDAGLIAQTLQAAGFDVVGARDLDQDSLRRAFRDFHDKAAASGPGTVAVVFLSGYGLQFEGENYFVPVDAKIDQASDVPAQAIRISDYLRPLEALKLKATILVLDAAHPNQFAQSGPPLAGGLALVEPEPGTLVAFNAAPGTVAPEGPGPYGAYAKALVEMIRDGGLPLNDVFDRTRLRVNEATKGGEVPWDASKIDAPFTFFVRGPDAPPPAVSEERTSELRSRPIRDFSARDAYLAALERDTLQGYVDFIAAYPDDPMAKRVRAIVAARREAIIWRRTRLTDTPRAYWSYLRRYPRGPHAYDARRRLEELAAALEPPPSFDIIEYDVPPPPPEEIVYVDRPVIYFEDPVFAFAPPPPVIFLPPVPVYIVELLPPPPPVIAFILPIPVYQPVPVWVQPPAYIAPPPPTNIIYNNIHNTVVINNTTNTVTITNQAGQTRTVTPQPAAPPPGGSRGAAPAPAVIGPALPPSLAHKAIPIQNQQTPGAGSQPNRGTGQQPQRPLGQPLPGASQGKPLPGGGGATKPGAAQPQPPIRQQQIQQPPNQVNKPNLPAPGKPLPPASGGARQPSPPPPAARPPSPPPAVRHPPPPPPPAARPPSPPPAVRHPPPPPPAARPPSPPPAVRHPPPPPPAVRHPPPPPPPPAARPPSPPPPAARAPVMRAPPPPPPAARPPSPPPPARQPPRGPAPPSCGGPGKPPCPR